MLQGIGNFCFDHYWGAVQNFVIFSNEICREEAQKVTKLFVKLAFQKRRDRVFWLF